MYGTSLLWSRMQIDVNSYQILSNQYNIMQNLIRQSSCYFDIEKIIWKFYSISEALFVYCDHAQEVLL